jgi:hypothetical protein
MSTSTKLASTLLYHGTNIKFNTGEVIKPRDLANGASVNYGVNPLYGEEVAEYAYAVNDIEEARWFAKECARKNGGRPVIYQVKGIGNSRSRRLYDVSNKDLPPQVLTVIEYLNKKGFLVIAKLGME